MPLPALATLLQPMLLASMPAFLVGMLEDVIKKVGVRERLLYSLGFLLAWTAVLFAERHPDISPWTGLVICAYPVIEVLFSIRRRQKRKTHVGHPDSLHLHSLIRVRLVRKILPNRSLLYQNSATSPFLWAFAVLPAPFAIAYHQSTSALVTLFLVYAFLYPLALAPSTPATGPMQYPRQPPLVDPTDPVGWLTVTQQERPFHCLRFGCGTLFHRLWNEFNFELTAHRISISLE